MSHVRQQIRDAVVARLTGLKTTAKNVMVGRTRPLPLDYDPTLLVYTTPAQSGGQEAAKPLSLSFPRSIQRTMSLSIWGRVQQADLPDDLLDVIAAEVETAMASDPTFGGLVKDSVLAGTVSQVDANGDRHEGGIRLVYSVIYITRENAPTVSS